LKIRQAKGRQAGNGFTAMLTTVPADQNLPAKVIVHGITGTRIGYGKGKVFLQTLKFFR